jgi:hypothetical protein
MIDQIGRPCVHGISGAAGPSCGDTWPVAADRQ